MGQLNAKRVPYPSNLVVDGVAWLPALRGNIRNRATLASNEFDVTRTIETRRGGYSKMEGN